MTYTDIDHRAAAAAGARVWLLDFSADRPDPLAGTRVREYIEAGESDLLHERYKCRIREPWYRVPGIVRGELLLSKRSHHYPRVVVNDACAFTTDTIYRGRVVAKNRGPRDIAAAFHNSLTLLSAELEGRSFGGGVLELVPSEVGRLSTIVPEGFASTLPELDRIARDGNAEALIDATDAKLVSVGAVPADLVLPLREARLELAERRIDRNARRLAEDTKTDSAIATVAA